MLEIIKTMSMLNPEQLMAVYLEGNRKNGASKFRDDNPAEQLKKAENSFLSYLRDEFFCQQDVVYCVWVVDGVYRSALRLEPYGDGLLLEALETAPDNRRKGYACGLLKAVLEYLCSTAYKCVYSHVDKRNTASLGVHFKCGFQQISDSATYIDGSVTQNSYTLCYCLR